MLTLCDGSALLLMVVLLAITHRNVASTACLALGNHNGWLVDSDATLFFALGQALACLALAGFQAAACHASRMQGHILWAFSLRTAAGNKLENKACTHNQVFED